MRDLCQKLNMRFYVSDAHFKELSNNGCCCGLPPEYRYSRGNFSYALQYAKKHGEVKWSDVAKDMSFLDTFMYVGATGFNTNSSENKAKFHSMTMKDYMRYLWNSPHRGQSPYKMFERVLVPDRWDADGNIVYRFNKSMTIQEKP